ncbi:MAG: recombinase RecT [Campylobacteraceae bacterium]|jgi:recombination protein RecT|nr:recombinase RecT [Campylobacteraceae bacterium]
MNEVTKFKDVLSDMVSRSAKAFPADVNSERLKINALMYIAQNPDLNVLAKSQPLKIAQYVYNFIALGLDMLNRECYIIPYKNQLTVLKDYKGEVKLAKKYSVEKIREIYARVVYERDEYYFEDNKFVHKFDPFKTDRGNKIGAFCTVIYENGVQQTEFVNINEVNKVKAVSQSAKSEYSPWAKWEDEMWKKTVIRKAMKNISLDFTNSELQNAYIQSENDVSFEPRKQADEVIEQPDVFDDEEEVSLDDL